MIQLPAVLEGFFEAAASVGRSASRYVYPAPQIGDIVTIHNPDDPYRHARHLEVVAFDHQPGFMYDRWAVTVRLHPDQTMVIPDYLVFKTRPSQLPPTSGLHSSVRLEAAL